MSHPSSVALGLAAECCDGGDDERARIVDAAWSVLRRARYRNLKMHMVARTAGVSIGALYRTFGSKEAVLAAMVRQEMMRATAVLTELTESGTPVERVRAWVESLASFGLGRQRARAQWFSTLPEHVSRLATEDFGPEIDLARPLRAAIADGVADGSFPNADAVWDAHLIEALCTRLCTSQPREADAELAVAKVVEFVLGTLQRDRSMVTKDRAPARALG